MLLPWALSQAQDPVLLGNQTYHIKQILFTMLHSHILWFWVLLPLHWSNLFSFCCLLIWLIPICWHWHLLTLHKVHKAERYMSIGAPSNVGHKTHWAYTEPLFLFMWLLCSPAYGHSCHWARGLQHPKLILFFFPLLPISQPAVQPASSELHWIV